MPVTVEQLLSLRRSNVESAYSERDTMLYALSVGMARDPLDRQELNYVYERRGSLQAMPSQAITVARHNLIFDVGLAIEKMLHGSQVLTLHRPLPPEARLLGDHRVRAVHDKGAGKGLLIEVESKIRLDDGSPLFDIWNLYVARGDGGIGGPATQPPGLAPVPQRAPDLIRSTQTLPGQALLYRLTGDRNVIHADPDIALSLGYRVPILHGSCTLGIACREILAGVCGHDPARLQSIGTRFTAVVFPGERIDTDIWIDGTQVRFRCRVPERDAVVLDFGECRISPH